MTDMYRIADPRATLLDLVLAKAGKNTRSASYRGDTGIGRRVESTAAAGGRYRVEVALPSHLPSTVNTTPLPSYRADYSSGNQYFTCPGGDSNRDYETEIIALARETAGRGGVPGSEAGYRELRQDYISEASPDRKGIIAEAATLLRVPAHMDYQSARVVDATGTPVAIYQPSHGWTAVLTEAEQKRQEEFDSIYMRGYGSGMEKSAGTAERKQYGGMLDISL